MQWQMNCSVTQSINSFTELCWGWHSLTPLLSALAQKPWPWTFLRSGSSSVASSQETHLGQGGNLHFFQSHPECTPTNSSALFTNTPLRPLFIDLLLESTVAFLFCPSYILSRRLSPLKPPAHYVVTHAPVRPNHPGSWLPLLSTRKRDFCCCRCCLFSFLSHSVIMAHPIPKGQHTQRHHQSCLWHDRSSAVSRQEHHTQEESLLNHARPNVEPKNTVSGRQCPGPWDEHLKTEGCLSVSAQQSFALGVDIMNHHQAPTYKMGKDAWTSEPTHPWQRRQS